MQTEEQGNGTLGEKENFTKREVGWKRMQKRKEKEKKYK